MQVRPTLRLSAIPALSFAAACAVGAGGGLFIPLPAWFSYLMAGVIAMIGTVVLFFSSWRRFGAFLAYLAIAILTLARSNGDIGRSDRALLAQLESDTVTAACRGVVIWREGGAETARSEHFWLDHVQLTLSDGSCFASNLRVNLSLPLALTGGIEIGDVIACEAVLQSAHARHLRSARELTWSLRERHWGDARISEDESLVIVKGGFSAARYVHEARRQVQAALRGLLSPDAAAIASALLLGSRETFSVDFREDVQTTGLAHLFALSGLNTGLLASLLWTVMSLLFVPRKWRYGVLLVLLSGYAVLGLGVPSLFRSTLMAGLFITGRLLAKSAHPANLLLAAMAIELFIWPLHLLDAGFALSYLSMAGIIAAYLTFSQPLQQLLNSEKSTFRGKLKDILSGTLGAQVATAPLAAMLFGKAPALAVLVNLIAIPLFSLLLVLILCALVLGSVSGLLAAPFAQSVNFLVWGFVKVTGIAADFPLASVGLSTSGPLIFLAFLAGVIAIVFMWRARLNAAFVMLLLCLNIVVWENAFSSNKHAEFIPLSRDLGGSSFIRIGECSCIAGFGADWEADRMVMVLDERMRMHGIKRADVALAISRKASAIGGARELLRYSRPRTFLNCAEPRETSASLMLDAASLLHCDQQLDLKRDQISQVSGVTVGNFCSTNLPQSECSIIAIADSSCAIVIAEGAEKEFSQHVAELLAQSRSVLLVDCNRATVSSFNCGRKIDPADQARRGNWFLGAEGWERQETSGERLMRLWQLDLLAARDRT
ncbi:MAG: ComEC/Rec2 family competence protein [Calditrichaeota bacterium]|nr:ComEC/Rec2 family competence protein [Calditrichota bacterium]MCB9366419.1 ComEC/Rec2 family competence protein [Calditrichota bacterium]